MTEGLNFWQRLDGEPDTAYNAFCVYRDMGITRTLRKAARAFYAEREEYKESTQELLTTAQVQRLKSWSAAWMWVARCEAFDAEESRERSLRMRERRIKTAELHWTVGQLAMQRVAERLQKLAWDEYVPLKSLAQLMNSAGNLQRLALGEPTAIESVQSRSHDEQDEGWLDGLTVEDREELARLAGFLEEDGYDLPEHNDDDGS